MWPRKPGRAEAVARVLAQRIRYEYRVLLQLGVTRERMFVMREEVGIVVEGLRVYDLRPALPIDFFFLMCAAPDLPALTAAIRPYVA